MEKYIKAETICNFIDGCLAHEDKITDSEKATLCAIKNFIERTSFIEVKPVKYAEWINGSLTWAKGGLTFDKETCSHCGKSISGTYNLPSFDCPKYCPNCGSKMKNPHYHAVEIDYDD